MTRDEALLLLHSYVKNPNMIKHCLASEAVLRALARKLGRDEEKWGLAGLLHDLDVEKTDDDRTKHSRMTAEILSGLGISADIIDAIAMHNNYAISRPRDNEFQHALAAGETITGMIIATTLVYKERKLEAVKPESVVKRMKEKAFAASVSRENIMECEKIGIPLPEFVVIALEAMKPVSRELGL